MRDVGARPPTACGELETKKKIYHRGTEDTESEDRGRQRLKTEESDENSEDKEEDLPQRHRGHRE